MFNSFLEFFGSENKGYVKRSEDIYLDFIMNYSKESFGSGLFRVVDSNNLEYFKRLVQSCFSELSDDIRVIGFDWLGRIFVSSDTSDSKIYMCDAGSHEILEIPLGIKEFLNNEIPEYPDELFALDFYKEYISQGGISPSYDQCIGYKVPLFLGGLDDLSNIEQIDFDVFWTLMTQLW
jgi:hypothetical protein